MTEFDSFTPTIADLDGHLVLVTAREHQSGIETTFGIKDPILADVVVLYPEGPVEYSDFQIFQARLIMKLKDRVGNGRPFLARLGKGAEYKGNIPWEFKSPTGADQKLAQLYMSGQDYTTPVVAPAVDSAAPAVTQSAPANSGITATYVPAGDDPFAPDFKG